MSKKEKSMLKWFKERRNTKIKQLLLQHAIKVFDATAAGQEYLDIITRENNPQDPRLKSIINRIISLERDADKIEIRLGNEIAKGFLPSTIRQNLFRLLKSDDSTINLMKSSMKSLHLLNNTDDEVPIEILEYFKQLLNLIHDSIRIVWISIENLGENDEIILSNKETILENEKKADTLFLEAKEKILIGRTRREPFSAILSLIEIATDLEIATDSVRDTAEFLVVIVKIGIAINKEIK